MRKLFIVIGILFLFIGFFFPYFKQIPFGRLPGDIVIDKPNLKIYVPITTMIILSIFLSVIFWLIRKFF